MPTIDRRQMLVAAGAAAIGTMVPMEMARAATRERTRPVVLFDPAIQGARAMARKQATTLDGATLLPVAGDRIHFWARNLRGHEGDIIGITGWNDFVLLRGVAVEDGRRVQSEHKLAAQTGASAFVWTIA